jgi:hypothetical protein
MYIIYHLLKMLPVSQIIYRPMVVWFMTDEMERVLKEVVVA